MAFLWLLLFCAVNAHSGSKDDHELSLVVHDVENVFRGKTYLPYTSLNESSVNSRHARDVGCNCGPGTLTCRNFIDGKLCKCENNRYVLNGDCKDCHCANAVCDFRDGSCDCLKGHANKDGVCIPCNCGDDINCHFSHGLEFCNCDGRMVLNAKCDECICEPNQFCFMLNTTIYCNCDAVNMESVCDGCKCAPGDKVCTVREREKQCKCMPGFAELNGVCSECKCQPSFKCSFVGGIQTCACPDGFAKDEKEDVCKECFCGKGHDCGISADGRKTCICEPNHIEHNGTCTKCNCSSANEMCEVKEGFVVCTCKENYVYSTIKKTCTECYCGEGHGCELVQGQKVCMCNEKYIENNGICEECDCGVDHFCEFKDGKKVCHCSENHSINNGRCEECSCGGLSTCLFRNGQKVCLCSGGFAEKNGKCEATGCSSNQFTCSNGVCIEGGQRCDRIYHCQDGSDELSCESCNEETCVQGICEKIGHTSICRCNEGFSGPMCTQQKAEQKATTSEYSTVVISVLIVSTLFCLLILTIIVFKCVKSKSQGYRKAELNDKSENVYANCEKLIDDETRI